MRRDPDVSHPAPDKPGKRFGPGVSRSDGQTPLPNSLDRKLYQRGHDIARAYLLAHAGDFGVDDIELAATISMRVVGNFAPWIALSVTDNDEREQFIAQVVRMLSQWIGAPG